MITVKIIHKTYKVMRRNAGFKNAVHALFSREYEVKHALDDLSFHINKGEMVGYIGPNGAGKSTTIKIMCGVLVPDSGNCVINGRTPWLDRLNHVHDIGVVFGQRSQLWWDVPVIDSFELIRDIYKVDLKLWRNNLDELVTLLDLSTILQTPTRNLSLGQRMKCEIVASLLHSPQILFLDEPTIGLDAVSKIAIRQFIKKLNMEHHTTVILTTHDMQDIEALTERVLFIGKGRLLFDDNIDELKKQVSKKKKITVKYKGQTPQFCDGMSILEQKEGISMFDLNPEILSVKSAIQYISSQTELLDISISDVTADEMVVELYKEYNI